ncbi:bifunctional precorrin-2 dehydrogenase/sirohydrochlorin ferrochelatase [Porphyrobacter sp. YT40]|uniref:precorrin-2 dehydrogenase/sirohydrochlorin ferrochelatase family protein n=1 Tax=Porphyrobacter sp. YT40 TaxID=2547601 RepID=UPI0011442F39|nr:bifunctional precorrin-2 dehydrogenase/sirohydrochlorin ferrochelatase [Porphyrobacter sp. YT40]QDH35532.1 bifunctional precorrin-2 dehydrogenase/sirohydrochlorin ferrochelatase [Porphyrobacter sp. YT40]
MSTIASLPLFHQVAGQQVLVLGDGPAAEPKRRLVERAGGVIVDDLARAIDEGVRLAFIAYEDASACEVAAINARCAGMLVNVVDRPELCDFTTPSILDRDPLLVAIGTGGASAGLAKHVRLRLEQVLPSNLGELARALEAARGRLRALFPDGRDRRRVLDQALQQGGPLDPLDPVKSGMAKVWLENPQEGPVVSNYTTAFDVRDANPDFLTVGQARALGVADTILLDGSVPDTILARARADARRLPYSEEARQKWAEGLTVILRWRPEGTPEGT